MATTPAVPFREAATIEQVSSHEYRMGVHADWSYGPAANGGVLTSLVWKAVAEHFRTTCAKYDQPDTISLHVEFLRPATLGDVTISIKDTRLGKVTSTVHCTMIQNGKERIAAYFTNANRSVSKGITMPTGFKLDPPIPPINFDAVLQNQDRDWIRYDIPYKAGSMNKILSNMIFAVKRQPSEDKTITQSWIGLSNPAERWTMEMLGLACDSYVPPLENFFDSSRSAQGIVRGAMESAEHGPRHTQWDLPRWYTTVNMTVDVKRALPKEGVKWLFTRMRTNEVIDGRLDIQGQIWDEAGNLIALVQYLWFVVDASKSVLSRASQESSERSSKM